MTEHDVVVVGGGVLGVFAAYQLVRAGRHVTLLEASPRLGGLGRGFDLGGFEIDIGVRMQPNSHPHVSRAFIEATSGTHRYLPICYRPRFAGRTDLPERSLARLLPARQRVRVALDRLRQQCGSPRTLGEIGRDTFSATAWRNIQRNYYESLLGPDCDTADVLNHFALGMDLTRPVHGTRDLRRALIDLVRGAPPRPVPSLGAPASWPAQHEDPGEVAQRGFFGLYPADGCYGRFLEQLVETFTRERHAQIELESPFEEIELRADRRARIRAGGQWFDAEDFVFTAGFPTLFGTVGANCDAPPMRALAQVNLIVRHPIPDCLWEVHYEGGRILRTFFPQRFRGDGNCRDDDNVIACETYHDPSAVAGLQGDSRSLVDAVVDELIANGTIPSRDVVSESRVVTIPRAVPVYPCGYFGQVRDAAERVRERTSNVHLAGTPATLRPLTPATHALDHLLRLAESLGHQRGASRLSTLTISPRANTAVEDT